MYTHRWYRPLMLDRDRYAAFVEDVRLLLAQLEGRAQVDAHLDANSIAFCINQAAWSDRRCVSERPEHHTPWESSCCWNACSTDIPVQHSPYDLLVCTLLIVLKYHFPEIVVDSDASAGLWVDAVAWYRACFADRLVLPGPWLSDGSLAWFLDSAMLDRQAQRLGYRVVREHGLLVLVSQGDPRNTRGKNQVFVDDTLGRRELAGWIRLLTDRAPLLDQSDSQWKQWSTLLGRAASWTEHLAEIWLVGNREYLDVRRIEAQDESGKFAWIPRRALSLCIETPHDLARYRLHLLEQDGRVRAVRIEEKWSGYNDQRNPLHVPFFPVGVLLALDKPLQPYQASE